VNVLRALRKAILGETWQLPLGIAASVGTAALVRAAAGPSSAFWRHGGGLLLAGLLVVALVAALPRQR
jgi:hypothetical protein